MGNGYPVNISCILELGYAEGYLVDLECFNIKSKFTSVEQECFLKPHDFNIVCPEQATPLCIAS